MSMSMSCVCVRVCVSAQLRAQLDVYMGGRAAEELFAEAKGVSVGAEADFAYARHLAVQMLSRWGLGRTLGPGGVADARLLSPDSQRLLDAEVLETLRASHGRAAALLRRHRPQLRAVAEALLQRETLSRAEVDAVLEDSRRAKPLLAWAMGWARPALEDEPIAVVVS